MFRNGYTLFCVLVTSVFSFVGYAQTAVSYYATEDAQVSSANPTTPLYGSYTYANVSVVSSTNYFRGLFKFNLSAIPSTAVIVSAKLVLKVISETGTGTTDMVAQGITGSWAEGTVNFSNQPATTSSNQQGTSSYVSGPPTTREFNVLNMIQAHVSGAIPLTGIMVRRNSETTTATPCQYATRETTAGNTDDPYLSIAWYDPVRISAATITKTTGLSTSDGGVSTTVLGGTYSGGSTSPSYKWYDSLGIISGATSTSISGKPKGCYGIAITPAYGPVYTMMFLVGTRCEIRTMDLLKDPLFVDDAEVYSFTPTTNSGGATTMNAGRSAGVSRNYYFYLRNRLWPDANISFFNATQYLNGSAHTTGGSNLANCYRTTADWTESTITWNNKPALDLTTPTTVLLSAPATSTENKVLNLTTFFQYWIANPTTSFGYGFIGSDASAAATSYQQYHTSDATASNRPRVTVSVDDATCDRFPYYQFKRKIDASYVFTEKGRLRAQFVEQHQQGTNKWAMKLYDNNRVLKAAIAIDGSSVLGAPLLPSVSSVYGDNRAILNLSTYSLTDGAYYILELTRSTGEIEFIEFIYKN